MGSYSDSTSDIEEELPVFDFLQPRPHLSHTEEPDDCDAEDAAIYSQAEGGAGTHTRVADVMMISSDSDDDDAPYVPLAQRLKQRQANVVSTSSTATEIKVAQQYVASNLASTQLSCQNGFPESEPVRSLCQVRTVSHAASDGPEEGAALPRLWLPPKALPAAGSTGRSPAKRKASKRTAEEIQASREEALRRRQARERQQRDKDLLRLEQEKQKAERKTLAEAAKALRPEECIKHMVVAVDPGNEKTSPYLAVHISG